MQAPLENQNESSRRKLAWPLAKSQTALATMLLAAGCALMPGRSPASLEYQVALTSGGIQVTTTVTGGPQPTAWVSFGASPLAGAATSRRIGQVTARTPSGQPLGVTRVADDGYRVEGTTSEGWLLDYHVEIGSPPAEFYHRASSRSDDHLVLVGAEVWARILDSGAGLQLPPFDRPLGDVNRATVGFDVSGFPQSWQVVSAAREISLNLFELSDHPALSAFAIGPYRYQDIDRDLGIRAAVHRDWTLARNRVIGYARQLTRTQAREFGPHPGGPALMIFTPLPPAARPRQGARTAGMVWDRSLILFAGADPSVPSGDKRVQEMAAIFLGHELFHLYVPWGLPITQPLSWLSEGWSEHIGRTSARSAGILSAAGAERSLREAYERYRDMGGSGAGSLQNASQSGEDMRPLLYVRGELVFRILSLEWQAGSNQGGFDSNFWRRLLAEFDGDTPLAPEAVTRALSTMVAPATVRRLVDGAAVITLTELQLGRR
jgi:hypothetical protein